jgi:4-amino-4-deoxy-L-arabinose transferase-like glycosyltransferase
MKKNQLLPALFISLFAVACYFPLFMHLDHMSVRLWDEGRRSVNAFEMAQNGNLLVTHYEGKPEMWGTKPPLLIWCEAACMKIIGYNEIALRLPSALAALATVIMLVLFCRKVLKRPLAGFLAGLVLVTVKGYVGAHVSRSGDFDSLLTLWETAYLLGFFTFFSHTDFTKKKKWLYLTAIFVALAGLTKGIAGFLFLPGIALFALVFGVGGGIPSKGSTAVFSDSQMPHIEGSRGVITLFRLKHFWWAVLLAIGPVLAFYLLREAFNPGYLAAVMDNEMGGRYLETQDGHDHPWYHYFKWLWREKFQPWLLFLPLGLAVGFLGKGRLRLCTSLLLLNSIAFLLVISFAKTRIIWYMAPVYPSLALLVGIGFEKLISGASHLLCKIRNPASGTLHYAVLAAFVFGMFWQPYSFIIERVYFEQHPKWDWPELKYRDFMRQAKDVKSYTIVHPRYNSHVVFYRNVFNLKGQEIRSQALTDFGRNKHRFGEEPLAFEPGAVLMICENAVFAALDTVYNYDTFRSWDTCKLLTIK